jgi:hypothetical protein
MRTWTKAAKMMSSTHCDCSISNLNLNIIDLVTKIHTRVSRLDSHMMEIVNLLIPSGNVRILDTYYTYTHMYIQQTMLSIGIFLALRRSAMFCIRGNDTVCMHAYVCTSNALHERRPEKCGHLQITIFLKMTNT